MQEYIDAPSILSEAKMMWNVNKKLYICVEGKTDKIFFNSLITDKYSIQIRVLKGWEKVKDVISLAREENYTKVLGIIDKDYHYINNDGIVPNEQLLITDDNDIEMMLFNSTAYDKFLEVCGQENKLKLFDDKRLKILEAAFPIGAFRSISLANNYCLCFDGFDYKSVMDRENLSIDVEKLIKKIIQRTCSKGKKVNLNKEKIINQISLIKSDKNITSYCNGHDILDMICIAMTKLYATASANEYNPTTIFNYLLMGYSFNEFKETSLHKEIKKWINSNQ
jgi:hypothetical protein